MFDPQVADKLRFGSTVHADVLDFIQQSKKFLERGRSGRLKKFEENEKSYRAYIDLPAASKARKNKARQGSDYPGTVPIVVPMAMGGVHAYLAYLMAVFGAQAPTFRLSGRKPEWVTAAERMEGVLDYQMEHTQVRGLLRMFYWFEDALIHGCGFIGVPWKTVVEDSIVWNQGPIGKMAESLGITPDFLAPTRSIEERVVFEGNRLRQIDPFNAYPDPRVPLSDLQDGDLFGYMYKESVAALEDEDDVYFNLEFVEKRNLKGVTGSSKDQQNRGATSPRQYLVGATMGGELSHDSSPAFPECFELHARIAPAELGLTDSRRTELWMFTMANNEVIIAAEKVDSVAQQIPVGAIEFLPSGHQFYNQGFVENVGPLQEHMSWVLNSHMESVRRLMNALIVYDPSRIVKADLEQDRLVKYIRLQPSAYQTNPKDAIHQIMLQDVTSNYTNDMSTLLDIYQRLTGVTDSIQGLPAKGRRTALEMGGVQSAAAGRLQLTAEIFSLGGVIPLAKMMVRNSQQYMSDATWVSIIGQDGGAAQNVQVQPWEIAGEFNYPVNDGTAPLEKQRLSEVWKEILIGVGQSPELSLALDPMKIFEQLAKTLGIRNIDEFRRNPIDMQVRIASNDEAQKGEQSGNLVPIPNGGGNGELSAVASALGPSVGR